MKRTLLISLVLALCGTVSAFALASKANGDASSADTWTAQNGHTTPATVPTDSSVAPAIGDLSINHTVTFSTGTYYTQKLVSYNTASQGYAKLVIDGGTLKIQGTSGVGNGGFGIWNNNASQHRYFELEIKDGLFIQKSSRTAVEQFTLASNEGGSFSTGVMTISGGTAIFQGGLALARNTTAAGNGASGTLYLQGGSLYILNTSGQVGTGLKTLGTNNAGGNATGTFHWISGNLAIAKQAESLANTGSGNLIFANASYNTSVATSDGAYNDVTFLPYGGIMTVADATAGVLSSAITYSQGANASMTFNVKGKTWGEFDAMLWRNGQETLAGGNITGHAVDLASGTTICLNITADFFMNEGDKFNIITADQLYVDGVRVTDSAQLQSINIVVSNGYLFDAEFNTDSNGRDLLTMVYRGIPEPAMSAALLGLLAMAAAARRRC